MYKQDQGEAQQRFTGWWKREYIGRPLMYIVGQREKSVEELEEVPVSCDKFDTERELIKYRNYFRSHAFMDGAFPTASFDLGPGSMALYLGCEPNFTDNTVWYRECANEGWGKFGSLKYDEHNKWWVLHQDMIKKAKSFAWEDFFINIPDIMENLDILSAMRGPQNLCYDLIDEPETIKNHIDKMEELFFRYFDTMYDIVKGKDGSSSYTAFRIWGMGRTAKVQCDFSSIMSPCQYREFALPFLKKQCRKIDNTLYHLDGQDAVKHLDAILEVEELNAVQWEPGDYNADGGSEKWYPIYDKIRTADKGLWIALRDGNIRNWTDNAEKLVKRYGSKGLYLIFPVMSEKDAYELIRKAERDWKN